MIVSQYILITLSTYLEALKELYWSNQLEMYLLSPAKLRTFYASSLTWTYLYATINTLLYFGVGVFIFGADLSFTSNVLVVVVVLFLLIISLSGIGLISASMFLLMDAKGQVEPVQFVMTTLTGLVGGVFFPPALFLANNVSFLYYISRIFPPSYAIDAIRRVLMLDQGFSNPEIQLSLLALAIFAVVLFPIGVYSFRMGIKKGEQTGSLAKWG